MIASDILWVCHWNPLHYFSQAVDFLDLFSDYLFFEAQCYVLALGHVVKLGHKEMVYFSGQELVLVHLFLFILSGILPVFWDELSFQVWFFLFIATALLLGFTVLF